MLRMAFGDSLLHLIQKDERFFYAVETNQADVRSFYRRLIAKADERHGMYLAQLKAESKRKS